MIVMSKLVTNFGDSVTTGNTVLQQNLVVQGAFATFSGNLLAGSAYSTIGNTTVKFNSVFATTANVTTANTVGIYGPLGVVGVGTTPVTGGANLQVQGNLFASNAFQAPNVFATTSMNTLTANVLGIFGPAWLVGVGTLTPTANLHVQGNVFASNALQSPVVIAGTSLNAATSNILGIFGPAGMTGVGTLTPSANLHVVGNVFASNAFQAPVVFASTSLNAATSNILGIFGPAGLTGVGTLTPAATLHVQGNVFASNAFQAPNVFATTSLNAATSNILGIFGPAGLTGVGTLAPAATLHVAGNVFASNAFQAPNVFATTSLNAATSNILGIFGPVGLTGVGTLIPAATLHVQGNVFASNALQAPNVFATTSLNAATSNILSIYGPAGLTGVGTATGLGATLHVQGNVWASNAIQTQNVFVSVSMNAATMNVTNIYGTAGVVGVGTVPVLGSATLQIQGNVFGSNALSAPNVFATTSLNALTANVTSIFGPAGLVGVGVSTGLGANLHILGNLFASNAVTAPVGNLTAATITGTLTTLSIYGPAGLVGVGTATPGANLDVVGNVWASNALQAPSVLATVSMNVTTMNALSIYGPTGLVGVNTTAPGSTLDVAGNVYVSNSIQTPNVLATTANVTVMNVLALYGQGGSVGIGTSTNLRGSLEVLGNVYVSNTIQVGNVITDTLNVTTLNTTSIFSTTGTVGVGTNVGVGANLHVVGNLYTTNAFQTAGNVFAGVSMNVPLVNTTAVFGTSGLVGVGLSTGLGATLHVQGNVFASNSIQAPNVFASVSLNVPTVNTTSVFGTSGLVGVGVSTGLGATLHVQGNVFASNSLQTQNVFASGTMNVPLINTTAIFGTFSNVGIGTSTGLGATLHVQGNIYASGGLTAASYSALTANIATMNVGTITGTVGVVTIPASLVLQGNLYVANTMTVTNVYANTLYYSTDLVKQAPYLQANVANAVAIQNWIGATTNLAKNSWWSMSARPSFGNVASGPVASTLSGAALMMDGRVVFSPSGAARVGIFNPATNQYTSVVPAGDTPTGTYSSSVVLPTGNVVFIPLGSSNVGTFNPSALQFSNVVRTGGTFFGGVLDPLGNVAMMPALATSNIGTFNPALGTFSNVTGTRFDGTMRGAVLLPNGNVICVPGTNANVVQFNPFVGTFSNSVQLGGSGTAKFSGGVLTPNGNVVFVPSSGATTSNVGVLNPSALTWTNVTTSTGLSAFSGGCLLPGGNVVFVPFNSANVGMFDTVTLAFSNSTVVSGAGLGSFVGGALVPDGRVVFCPAAAANVGALGTLTPVGREFCLAPYFNKF